MSATRKIALVEIFKELRVHRQDAGLTQKQLAQQSGASQQTISAIENGVMEPSIKLIRKLMKPLGIETVIIEAEEKYGKTNHACVE